MCTVHGHKRTQKAEFAYSTSMRLWSWSQHALNFERVERSTVPSNGRLGVTLV